MTNFKIEKPFELKPPRLRDLVNEHVMADVWVRDTPFGPVTDSLKIAEHFDMSHKHILRAIDKCRIELGTQPKWEKTKLQKNGYHPIRTHTIALIYQHSQGSKNFS